MVEDRQAAMLKLQEHLKALKSCQSCPNMIGPVVTHRPVLSKVILVGQAPGPKEGSIGQPFAWTAGKTLFKWLWQIGLSEEEFRSLAYMAAVCRCFPGKTKQGGDRVPDQLEVKACSQWLKSEFAILKPQLVIPVGRLAIEQFLPKAPLQEIIGNQYHQRIYDTECDIVPLPHPSGASTWFKREPGITLLSKALGIIENHPSWQHLKDSR